MPSQEIKGQSKLPYHTHAWGLIRASVMVPVHVVDVRQTMPSAYLAKGKSLTIKFILKGMCQVFYLGIWSDLTADTLRC